MRFDRVCGKVLRLPASVYYASSDVYMCSFARSSNVYICSFHGRATLSLNIYGALRIGDSLKAKECDVCFVKIRLHVPIYDHVVGAVVCTLYIGPVPRYSTILKILCANLRKSHTNDFIRFIYSYLEGV